MKYGRKHGGFPVVKTRFCGRWKTSLQLTRRLISLEPVTKELLDLAEAIRRKRLKLEEIGDPEAIKLVVFLETFVRHAAEVWPIIYSAKEA